MSRVNPVFWGVAMFVVMVGSCAMFLSVGVAWERQAGVSISGVVRDPAGNPLPGTDVRVLDRGGRTLDNGVTDINGKYRLGVQAGSPIKIEYDNPKWHVRTVHDLSRVAGDDQRISKVLLDARGPEEFALIAEQILAYDQIRLAYEYGSGQKRDIGLLREKYRARILGIPHPLRGSHLGDQQRRTIQKLTPTQQNVINRMMGDLLFRYGFTDQPIYE